MPGYIAYVFSKLQHNAPNHPHHTPSIYVMSIYGAETQYAMQYETPPLTAKQCLSIQKVKGSVLYYARAVDQTFLIPSMILPLIKQKPLEKHKRQLTNC
jgi:hypothetical protein